MAQTIVILVVLGILIMIDNKVLEQNRLTNTCSIDFLKLEMNLIFFFLDT